MSTNGDLLFKKPKPTLTHPRCVGDDRKHSFNCGIFTLVLTVSSLFGTTSFDF